MAKPINPTNLKAVYNQAADQVTLTWVLPASSPVTTQVRIQRWVDTTQVYTDLTTIAAGTSYADTSVADGRTYAYRIISINSEGSPSVFSTPSNKVLIVATPDAAEDVTAQRNANNSVGVNWENQPSVLKPITYNYIFRWDNVSGKTVQINRIAGGLEYYLDSTAPLDRGLRYRIWAANSAGGAYYMSPFSGLVYTTPAAPTGFSARWVGNDIVVSWTNPSKIASQFQIEHSTDGTAWFPVTTLGKATSWKHTTPERGVPHRYRIRPLSPAPPLGTAAVGSWVTSAFVPAQSTPNPPTILGPVFAASGSPFTMEIRHNPIDDSPMGAARIRHRAAGGTWSAVVAGLTVPSYVSGDVEVQASTRTPDSAFGDWSTSAVVRIKARPVPSVSSPSAGAVVTGPVIPLAWTTTTQTAFEAELLQGATVIQSRSGTTARSTTFDAEDSQSYTVRVRISDGELWSNWVTRSVTTSFTAPNAPTLSLIQDPANLNITAHVPAVTGAARREVLRRRANNPTDQWTSIGNTDSNGYILDPRPPLGVELEYTAVAWGANGSSAVSPSQYVTVDRHVVVINYGPGLGASAYMEVDLSPLAASIKRERALHQFAGRALPVEVLGSAQGHSVSASGRVVDEIGSSPAIWRDMLAASGPKWFRDPEGRSFACSIDTVDLKQLDGWTDVSFTAEEVGT